MSQHAAEIFLTFDSDLRDLRIWQFLRAKPPGRRLFPRNHQSTTDHDLAMARIIQLILLFLGSVVALAHATDVVEKFLSRSGHTNNWAVLVSTSRFWFNYRVLPPSLSTH